MALLQRPDGGLERRYDRDEDGRVDAVEVLNASGLVTALQYDRNGDGALDEPIAWRGVGVNDRGPSVRHLLIILDSVPFELVQEVRRQGRFACFQIPSRIISPFPAMTDPCLTEFFGISPCPGVESAYFDGHRLTNASGTYVTGGNAPWFALTDYYLPMMDHLLNYAYPSPWFEYGLGQLQLAFEASAKRDFIGYMVGTSGAGSKRGRNGHIESLIRVDRLCQQLIANANGQLQITLMSDHGHTCMPTDTISLRASLSRFGYRISNALDAGQDVVVPEWGLVSCAALYCRPDVAQQLARDTVMITGVELTAFAQADDVVAVSRDGSARIRRDGARFAYVMEGADPLHLAETCERLKASGRMDAAGFADDHDWLEATLEHEYPDPLARMHRAFHGLFTHVPQVLVSLADGYCHGSPQLGSLLRMAAVHGSLRMQSSSGFVMSTVAPLPPVVRMAELAGAMQRAGVPVREQAEYKR